VQLFIVFADVGANQLVVPASHSHGPVDWYLGCLKFVRLI